MSLSWRVPVLVAAMAVPTLAPAAAAPADREDRVERVERAKAKRLPEPVAAYDLPFPCNQTWVASTRASHSPSRHAVDFNRVKDQGKPVVASASGTVSVAQRKVRNGYGRYVVIDHGNGDTTLYAHLQQVFVVPGAPVDQGTLIGTVGVTGNTSGAHLHYEQKVGRDVVPPMIGRSPFTSGSHISRNCVDVPMAGNLTGGPAAEVAVFRRMGRARFLSPSTDRAAPTEIRFGVAIDQPLLADWDGDGRDDVAVWSPRGRVFKIPGGSGVTRIKLGIRGDRPVTGDWDGDGLAEVGVFRPARSRFILQNASGRRTRVDLGHLGVVPVTGDWDGDGRTDLGVFDPSTAVFTLRTVGADGAVTLESVPFGVAGDIPVTGDWDGDGRTDLGVWTPSTAVFQQRQAEHPAAPPRVVVSTVFGTPR